MKQYYESVQSALESRVGALRKQAIQQYEEAFDELEDYRDEHGVENVLPDRGQRLDRIRRYDDPNRLQVELSKVSDFKTRYRVQIRDVAEQQKADDHPAEDVEDTPPQPKTTEPFSVSEAMGQRDIESEKDVDAFLQDLRGELIRRVNEDKIIVIS